MTEPLRAKHLSPEHRRILDEDRQRLLARAASRPTPPQGFRVCSHCGESKPIADFAPLTPALATNADGTCRMCEGCRKIRRVKYGQTERRRLEGWQR